MPPPIPRSKDQWLLACLFMIGGFLLIGLLNNSFFGLLNRNYLEDSWEPSRASQYFWDFRALIMVPLALLADFFMDRRDSMVVGAFMIALGLLLLILPIGLFMIPGMVFAGAGMILFELSLLAYFGSRWPGGLLRKDAGYTILIAAGLFGGGVSGILELLDFEVGRLPLSAILLFLVSIGAGVIGIVIRKEPILAAEKIPTTRRPDRTLGIVLTIGFAVISIIAFALLNFFEPDRDLTNLLFTFGGVVTLTFGLIIFLTVQNYPTREKLSAILVVFLGLLFWAVYQPAFQVMNDGWDFFRSSEEPYARTNYAYVGLARNFIPFIGVGLLALLWYFYPKKGRGELFSGVKMLGGLFLVMLIPLVISGVGPHELGLGWYALWAIFYAIIFSAIQGVFLSMIWKFSPARWRMVGFAMFYMGGYFVYRIREFKNMIFEMEDWYEGPAFDTLTTILGVLMLFAAAALLFVRMRKWD